MRRNGILLSTIAAVAGLIAVMFIAQPAEAHPAGDFYGPTKAGLWPNSHSEPYHIRAGFPSSTWLVRIQDGSDAWNAAGGASEPTLYYAGTTSNVGNFDTPCSSDYSGIYYRDLDYINSGYLGLTRTCNAFGQISNFQISIDTDRNWSVSSGPPASNEFDFQGVITHEMGHGTGWYGHFTLPADCPNTSADQTMCVATSPGDFTWRSLAGHDLHTFLAAY